MSSVFNTSISSLFLRNSSAFLCLAFSFSIATILTGGGGARTVALAMFQPAKATSATIATFRSNTRYGDFVFLLAIAAS
jgi:hypothetical protein